MKKKPKQPHVPAERYDTVRQEIISALTGQTLTAKEISPMVKASEKEIYSHLEHIQKTIKQEHALIITPAECRKCGFIFKKRARLKKPGKCPVCKSEQIQEPLFSIKD